jgi:AraC-like DNA-binding protein
MASRASCRRLPCGKPGVLLTSPASDTLIAVRSPHDEWPSQTDGVALKAVLEGEREFWVEERRYVLGPGRYLLLPPGPRRVLGRSSRHVSMLPVWFSEATARSVADTMGARTEESLLAGRGSGRAWDESLLPRSPALEGKVRRLWRFALHAEAQGSGWDGTPELESLLLETLASAWRAARRGERRLARLSSVRAATRLEIVRRLSAVEDALCGGFRSAQSLTELAGTAEMSPYHFLRRFREYYGTTPHRYLTRLRLGHARRLLARGTKSVKQVAFECGYRSVPSFVHLCSREWGVRPSALAR